MTYDQLITFEAIVKEGSFKAASHILFKTQPSLSMAIKKLEEELNFELFNRQTYRPTLTEKGEIFHEQAQHALLAMRQLEVSAQDLNQGIEPHLHIGLDLLAVYSPFLTQISPFLETIQTTQLHFTSGSVSGIMESIVNGQLDLGITPIFQSSRQIESHFLFTLSLIPVYSSSLNLQLEKMTTNEVHSFFRRHPQVIIKDSAQHQSLSVGVILGGRQWRTSSLEIKAQLIHQGLGWGRLPKHMVQNSLNQGALSQIPLDILEPIEIPLYLIRDPRRSFGKNTNDLWCNIIALANKNHLESIFAP